MFTRSGAALDLLTEIEEMLRWLADNEPSDCYVLTPEVGNPDKRKWLYMAAWKGFRKPGGRCFTVSREIDDQCTMIHSMLELWKSLKKDMGQ